MAIHVLIPAGGKGLRFGGSVKKQFLQWEGDTILNQTIKEFLKFEFIDSVTVALPKEELLAQKQALENSKLFYTKGGKSRAESVRNAFLNLKNKNQNDVILVHDAVRPLFTQDLVLQIVAAIQEHGQAIPYKKITDTIKKIENGFVQKTYDRNFLGGAQTPQGATVCVFEKIYKNLGDELQKYTDEAMQFEALGLSVKAVQGCESNIKITTPFDLELAKLLKRKKNDL